MTRFWMALGLATAIALPLSARAGEVSVRFVAPETYADADIGQRLASEAGRAQVLGEIERHLQGLAQRTLPAGQALTVEVLDIDLAGHFEPFPRASSQDLRVVRAIDAPRLTLRDRLTQGERVLAQGEQALSDLGFLSSAHRRLGSDTLRHEKALLDRWFATLVERP